MNKTDKELLILFASLKQIEKQLFYYILRKHPTPYEFFILSKDRFLSTTFSTPMNRLLDEGFLAYHRRTGLSDVRVVIQPLACQLFDILKHDETEQLYKTFYRYE